MVTQKNISENLGISQATVSYVLNGYSRAYKGGRVSQETADSIIQEASRLNYQPKTSSKRNTKTIALLNSYGREGFWYPGLLKGVQDVAAEASYMVTHHIFDESGFPQQLLASVDGVIALELPQQWDLAEISEQVPVVILNNNDLTDKYDTVMTDHYNGIRKAIKHLYEMGHRKFGFFGMRGFPLHHAERYGAYQQVIAELDLPVPDPNRIFIPERNNRTPYDMAEKIKETFNTIISLKKRPSALICAADCYALAFIRMAGDFGIKIPDELSIVGFDDVPECESCNPSLSSVTQPLEEMGRVAAELLFRRINGYDASPLNLRVPAEWRPRKSIAASVLDKS